MTELDDAIANAMDHMVDVDRDEGRMQVLEIIDKYQPLLARSTPDRYVTVCLGCDAVEGELHDWGCDFEFCPRCGHYDITECECGFTSPLECAQYGRWPFCGYREKRCDLCAGHVRFWKIPDDEWIRVTGPEHYRSRLCIPCFARMRSIVDQHRSNIAIEHALRSATMKDAEVRLPFFKQGDDLDYYVSRCSSVEEALEAHAQDLDEAAAILRGVREMIAGKDVSVRADTHTILVSGPDEVIDALIAAKYASPGWDEDEELQAEEDRDEACN